ncbi:hypothetical protein M3Y99_01500600 [Aphelenchoides fujianensis]|nr:hypothetical protein M3Y99_01500600 [Aphelenchoides fujianensis]
MRLLFLSVLLFATMFTTAKAAMAIDFGELGMPFSLQFGPNNSVIKRQWDEKREPQTIKVGTDFWTTNGSYTMPDEPVHHRGGGIVGPTMIVVRLRDD